MRLTPSQVGMYALLGESLPMGDPLDETPVERIRRGHAFLVQITGADLGYDPKAWHEHLCASDAGGYRWSNKHLGFPRKIARALANPTWQRAVVQLKGGRPEPVSGDEE